MKPVPESITASGPAGTVWFGGSVDRSTMALRVMPKERGESVDKEKVACLLGHSSDREKPAHWSLHTPSKENADLDSQVDWILSQLTGDLDVWKRIGATYRVDLFCGLFLEQANRGTALKPQTLSALGSRGITLSLDIYAP